MKVRYRIDWDGEYSSINIASESDLDTYGSLTDAKKDLITRSQLLIERYRASIRRTKKLKAKDFQQ